MPARTGEPARKDSHIAQDGGELRLGPAARSSALERRTWKTRELTDIRFLKLIA